MRVAAPPPWPSHIQCRGKDEREELGGLESKEILLVGHSMFM